LTIEQTCPVGSDGAIEYIGDVGHTHANAQL
jgi:hypothetical protein